MENADLFIALASWVAIIAAVGFFLRVRMVKVEQENLPDNEETQEITSESRAKLIEISGAITEGAKAFLFAEYAYVSVFMCIFAVIIAVAVDDGVATAAAFVYGSITSLVCGYLGMMIAVYANVRVTINAVHGWSGAFLIAFQSGAVMGFSLVGIALFNLWVLIQILESCDYEKEVMYEIVAGYGLGGSAMALFGRVGGGIYTKAADVGADLVGKIEQGIPEDDPRNPATIADNVGDNVGDIAGMGADLFGSFAEATCAALVISSSVAAKICVDDACDSVTMEMLSSSESAMLYPLALSAGGIFVCLFTSMLPAIFPVTKESEIEPTLKWQLIVSTVLMTPVGYALSIGMLPDNFMIEETQTTNLKIFACFACGLWAGLIIGFITEYYTSHSYKPVREVAEACGTGAATNIIYGLALGYKSAIVPVFAIAVTIYVAFKSGDMYGIAVAALGMLSTLSIGLTIDAYGPISDNAGGIAEMAELGEEVREKTDALDAAGNTTAAIGKGFAIGSAVLVSLALFGAFTVRAGIKENHEAVDVLNPLVFAGLLVGALLPYWFSAMTMKSVGKAALAMVMEVRDQFANNPGIMTGETKPDYKRCVKISTDASLKEMLPPGILVIGSPLLCGFLFGELALAGLLAGSLVSGVQLAISASNSGGAWDNAKKYIEKGNHGGKGTDHHKAAVVGDTVGDPLKDTSGPSLNILMKLMAIISLVFGASIVENGGLILSS